MKSVLVKLLKSAVFLLILGTLILKTGIFLRPINKDANVWTDYYSLEKNSIDTVLIGSSALYRYWIPAKAYDQHGYTSSMIFCSSQDAEAVPYLIEEIVKTQDPEVICVETRRVISARLRDIRNQTDDASIEYYTSIMMSGMKPSLNKYRMIGRTLTTKKDRILEYMVPLLKYHDNIYEYKFQELLDRDSQDVIYNGLELPITVVEEHEFQVYDEEEYTDDKIPDEYLTILDEIVETADRYGKKVLFISTPYVTSAIGQTLRAQMYQYMDEKGYDYVDMTTITDEMGIDFETDLYNGAHVNVSGAEKVTDYLGNYINDKYQINKEHSSAVTEFWDEYASKWREKEPELLEEWKENCS